MLIKTGHCTQTTKIVAFLERFQVANGNLRRLKHIKTPKHRPIYRLSNFIMMFCNVHACKQ